MPFVNSLSKVRPDKAMGLIDLVTLESEFFFEVPLSAQTLCATRPASSGTDQYSHNKLGVQSVLVVIVMIMFVWSWIIYRIVLGEADRVLLIKQALTI